MLAGTVAVVLLVELAVRSVTGHLPEPQVWSTPEIQYKVELIDHGGPVDIALVGSSVVDVSIDPEGLDDPAFNAALGAASIGMIADFTRAVVAPRLDPDIVVIGLTSRELNPNSLEQGQIEERFRQAPAVRHVLGTESVLDRLERSVESVSALVAYRSILRDPENWVGDPPRQWGSSVTADSGLYLDFLDEQYRYDEGTERRLGEGALRDYLLGGEQLDTLRTLITDLTDDGRHVLLLATPVTEDYVALHPGGGADHRDFLAALRLLADDTGVAFATSGVWDRTFFADPLHVNRAGAERLTELLDDALADQNWK